MSAQTICQLVVALGIVLTAGGGLGAFYFGGIEDTNKQLAFDAQLATLQNSLNQNTQLLYEALNVKKDVWIPVQMNGAPSGVADYLLLLLGQTRAALAERYAYRGRKQFRVSQLALMAAHLLRYRTCGTRLHGRINRLRFLSSPSLKRSIQTPASKFLPAVGLILGGENRLSANPNI